MKKLSEKQQSILSAYYDRELGFLTNFYVEKFLLQSPAAKEFLAELSSLSAQFIADYQPAEIDNKWNVLNSRLLQIDKNSIFHEADLPKISIVESFWKRHPIPATLATASTAFCLGLIFKLGFVNLFETTPVNTAPQTIASAVTSPNITSAVSTNLPVTLASNHGLRSAVELDWVKSDGRIRMIPAGKGTSNIIWVKAPRSRYLANVQQNK